MEILCIPNRFKCEKLKRDLLNLKKIKINIPSTLENKVPEIVIEKNKNARNILQRIIGS